MTGCIAPGGDVLPCAAPLPRAPAGGACGDGFHNGCCRAPCGRERKVFRTG